MTQKNYCRIEITMVYTIEKLVHIRPIHLSLSASSPLDMNPLQDKSHFYFMS